MQDIMQNPNLVADSKFTDRTGLRAAERNRLVGMANAGRLPGEEGDVVDEIVEQEESEGYVYTAPDDNDLLDELDQAADEETVEPKGENGVHWI